MKTRYEGREVVCPIPLATILKLRMLRLNIHTDTRQQDNTHNPAIEIFAHKHKLKTEGERHRKLILLLTLPFLLFLQVLNVYFPFLNHLSLPQSPSLPLFPSLSLPFIPSPSLSLPKLSLSLSLFSLFLTLTHSLSVPSLSLFLSLPPSLFYSYPLFFFHSH